MSQDTDPSTARPEPGPRLGVQLVQMGHGRFKATNAREGVLPIGGGDDPDFTPAELLLAALAGAGAIDLELATRDLAGFETFAAYAEADRVRDADDDRLTGLRVTVDLAFPRGPDGDRAREVVRARLADPGVRFGAAARTISLGEPVTYLEGPLQP